MAGAVLQLNQETFDETVGSAELPVLIEFWAEWCPPCRVLSPVLDAIAATQADRLLVGQVNSDEQTELARRYEVMSVPTLLVFRDGELQRRMVGARSQARLLEELSDVLIG